MPVVFTLCFLVLLPFGHFNTKCPSPLHCWKFLRALQLEKGWLSPKSFVAKSSKNLVLTGMVLVDSRTVSCNQSWNFSLSFWTWKLDNWKVILTWTLARAVGWCRRDCKPVSWAKSHCCMFAMSRKLNLLSLEHNWFLATCCCDEAREGALPRWRKGEAPSHDICHMHCSCIA